MDVVPSVPSYDFEVAFQEWSRVPWDEFGYMDSTDVLRLPQTQFRKLLDLTNLTRWDERQWRNRGGSLSRFLEPTRGCWQGKRVLDFGCGFGADSIQFSSRGAEVLIADVSPATLLLAQRSLATYGLACWALVLNGPEPPFFLHDVVRRGFDLFWSNGVLHHTPRAADILRSACEHLRPGGECRVTLYSARRWREMTGTEPPERTWEHPKFHQFVRACDGVGQWADWYDLDKLQRVVGDFAEVASCEDLYDGQMVGVVLRPRRSS